MDKSINIHPDDALHMERELRRVRIMLVEREMQSDYWKILKMKLEAWILQAEKNRLSVLDRGVNEKTLKILNEEKIKMDVLGMVLKINESIIYENKTWIDRFKDKANEVREYVATFVGYGRQDEK